MTDHIRTERRGTTLALTMVRPEKKNALTDAMYGALADALESADGDDTVRAVLIRGEGDMFTAGNDLGDFAAIASADPSAPRQVTRFLHALVTLSKPLVAAVQGRAVGVGTTMLLHCDHVVMADDAQLTAPFVGLGLVPEAGSSLLLPARIGHLRAFAMFALGQPLSAADALASGLANAVVPAGDLDAAADAVLERLARQPLGALIATKRLMRDADALQSVMSAESMIFFQRLQSAEAQEAFAAFAERRPADFSSIR